MHASKKANLVTNKEISFQLKSHRSESERYGHRLVPAPDHTPPIRPSMRPSAATIDLTALRHNYALARQYHGGKVLAVLKANAYGHGANACARALAGIADGFAVAFVAEASALRDSGVTAPILVLEGPFDDHEVVEAARCSLWLTIHHAEQLRMLETLSHSAALPAWLKVNSGMNRVGFDPARLAQIWQRLRACTGVGDITLMTHLARADELDIAATDEQIARFDAATQGLPGARSIANSSGIFAWPAARRDWGRCGIALYGAAPDACTATVGLRAAMRLHSKIFAVRDLAAGAPLGYGGRFVAPRPTRVGLVACGYADGYPRTAPDGTPVAIDGKPTVLIGRVSMDMLTVDLTDLPEAGIGSTVELWGATVSVDEVARRAGTVAYELLCNVKRVPLTYVDTESGLAT